MQSLKTTMPTKRDWIERKICRLVFLKLSEDFQTQAQLSEDANCCWKSDNLLQQKITEKKTNDEKTDSYSIYFFSKFSKIVIISKLQGFFRVCYL